MVNKKGTALSLVRADIPADKEDEFNLWYNSEHIPELLALPGYLNAARYVALRGGPQYLACYELDSPDAVNTEAAQRRRANPTEWGKRIDPNVIGTNFSVNLYQQIFPAQVSQDAAQADMAPVLQIGCMDVPPEAEDEFNEWYNTIYVPNFEKVPGCIRGRRYRAVRGEPKYATVYEFEHEGVPQTPEWTAAREAHPQSPRMRSLMKHAPGSPAVYKKIFPL